MNVFLRLKNYVLIAGFLVVAMLAAATPLAAQSDEATPTADDRESLAFEFYPTESGWGSFLAATIEAGTTADLSMTIANVGDVEQGIRTFAVNAFTAPGGGFANGEPEDDPTEVTTWMTFPEETVTLEPGEVVERLFTVSVPDNTAPGQYITAVAGEHAEASEIEGQPNLSQTLRYVVPVFITVPGPMTTSFQIEDVALIFEGDSLVAHIQIQNTGDVRVRPEGTVEIRSSSGDRLATIPVGMDSVYAREGTDLTIGLPGDLGDGTYGVAVELTDPESGETATLDQTGLLVAVAEIAPNGSSDIQFADIAIVPEPSADEIQFLAIDAVISNTGEPVGNAQLSLIARLDGKEVERFPLNQSLALPAGDTSVSARYIPATGWTSGTWTFEFLVETVEPSGAAIVEDSVVLADQIEIE